MGRTTSPERVNRRRHNVLAKAAELFAEKGFHATSVEDIAKALKLTKGSVYYYIPSKDEILFQVHEYAHDLLLNGVRAVVSTSDPPDVKLRNIIITHIVTCCSEMSVVAAMLQMQFALSGEPREKIVEKRDQYDRMLRQVIQEGVDGGLFVKCDPTMIAFFILGFINYTSHWYKDSGRLSKQAIAEMFADVMLRALLRDQGNRIDFQPLAIEEVTRALTTMAADADQPAATTKPTAVSKRARLSGSRSVRS